MEAAKEIRRASVPAKRLFKAAAIGAIAAFTVGTGFLGSQALARTSSQTISKVLVGPSLQQAATCGSSQNWWIGRSVREVEDKLGQPSQIYRLRDTGGEMLIYAYPYAKHYVFYAGPAPAANQDSAQCPLTRHSSK